MNYINEYAKSPINLRVRLQIDYISLSNVYLCFLRELVFKPTYMDLRMVT